MALITSREMSNILEKFKNVTHFKVKRDNLLRHTLTLFHLFLNARIIFQGASRVVTQHLAHCLPPLPPAPCSTPVSTWKRGASMSWEETELFFSNKCLPEGSDGEKLVAVTLAFQGQKSTICHPGTLLCYIVSD